ncbi:MAG TPA: hypothetical protein VG710_06440 [Opitutus sp.]|nr:hypothetical protein [Opitutus sp.]
MSSKQPVKPFVYLILGAAGSGRRAVVADLIEGGLDETDRPAVLVSDAEGADATELPGTRTWKWTGEAIAGTLPADATQVFFVADGRSNPVDQVEAFKPWLEAQGGELARVLCVVDCQLAGQHPELLAWYDACVHFSDVVLLNRREGVENKWISDFQGHFKKQFLPALFELVKGGRVKNPRLVLEPEARRMSHFFEAEPDWTVGGSDGDELDEEAGDGDEEEVELVAKEDPYLERRAGGRRVKQIPDVSGFLK